MAKEQRRAKILSGIQPSGIAHIGNYLGMMKPAIELQNSGNETFLFIADYHSLTTCPAAEELRQRSLDMALDFLACGLDPAKTVFFRQSEVPQVTELTWILSCQTTVGLLERAHSYKDKIANDIIPNNGLLSYPVLMASDILIYKSDIVPVGKDQKQHLEMTRDIALRFNRLYGDIFTIPEEKIVADVAIVPGTDGRKMSKSYNNTIPIFGREKAIRKIVMSLVTDSRTLEEAKDPDCCNVMALYRLFAEDAQVAELEDKYRAGNFGYGHAKQALFELLWDYFAKFRIRREELQDNLDYVHKILAEGGEKARDCAEDTMKEVRRAVGLR